MLKIKPEHHLDFPHLTFSLPHVMELSRPAEDSDELARAISNDPEDHDNNWELTDHPDTTELEQYWEKVEEDIKNDPEWINFSEDKDADWIGLQ